MTPTVARGDKLHVQPIGAADVAAGDVALIIDTPEAELLVHRVMHVFQQDGQTFVVHQGDATGAAFAICGRASVIGRVVALATDPASTLPVFDEGRFQRRRLACRTFCSARELARLFGLQQQPTARRAARLFRALAKVLTG